MYAVPVYGPIGPLYAVVLTPFTTNRTTPFAEDGSSTECWATPFRPVGMETAGPKETPLMVHCPVRIAPEIVDWPEASVSTTSARPMVLLPLFQIRTRIDLTIGREAVAEACVVAVTVLLAADSLPFVPTALTTKE